MKDLYEIILGQMKDDGYTTKLLELIRYLPKLKEENKNIQRYVSGLPQSFKDKIEFDEPKSLEDTIQKLMTFYE